MTHLEIIAIMALISLGAHRAMGEGMVLEWWYDALTVLPVWLQKPMGYCPRCMVSFWGIPAVVVMGYDVPWVMWPVYLLAACGLQEAIDK
jgi:hypothetical protein